MNAYYKMLGFFLLLNWLTFSEILGQNYLNVPLVGQKNTEWCWAASIEMIHTFHNGSAPFTQCDLARRHEEFKHREKNLTPLPTSRFAKCCDSDCEGETRATIVPAFPPIIHINCNQPIMFSRRQNAGYIYPKFFDLINLSYNYNSIEDVEVFSFDWTKMVQEINQCRPFAIFLNKVTTTSQYNHVVVAKGYNEESNGEQFILVNDPQSISGTVDCIGHESYIPISSLFDDYSKTNSALQFARAIFPQDKNYCEDCIKLLPIHQNRLALLINQNTKDGVFIGMRKSKYSASEYNSFLKSDIPGRGSLYLENKLMIRSLNDTASKSCKILVAKESKPQLAVLFEQANGFYYVKEIFENLPSLYSAQIQLQLPNGEKNEFKSDQFEVIEFVPGYQKFYRVQLRGKFYLSPAFNYPGLAFKERYLYDEYEVVKELTKQYQIKYNEKAPKSIPSKKLMGIKRGVLNE